MLGFEEVTVTTSEREGLTRAQYARVDRMMATLTQQGRNNMMTGLMAYMAYLMGDIADLAREHMCTERSTAGRPSSSRDPATRPGTDEVLVELDPPTEDGESDAGTEEEDNMMTMQLWHELKEGDEGALMQTFAESNHPVYGMLVETFVVALQKHDERERANIAAHMLKLLRDGARNGTASMSEQAETLEAALVVFSDGASTTVFGSSAHSDRVKHWWNLLAPHLARGGACESRSGTVVGPASLRRRRDPLLGRWRWSSAMRRNAMRRTP